MAQDIVPALLDEIENAFEEKVNSSKKLKRIEEKISKKLAKLEDGHAYAEEIGDLLSDALREKITAEKLPDGKLYWNIADRTVRPMLGQNHKLVNDAAEEIQAIQDEMDGVGLKAVRSEFPEERVRGLIDKMASESEVEKALQWLGEPIVNCTSSFFDSFVEENADFRHRSGMHETIERVATPGSCKWCQAVAGLHEYSPDMNRDVFRRHENCRCLVTFQSGRKRQNVWSKELWEEESINNNSLSNKQNIEKRGKDVTGEYYDNIRYDRPRYKFEKGYNESDQKEHKRKIETAKIISKELGIKVTLLKNANKDNVFSPDYMLNSKLWDLKSVTTEKSANSAIRHGLDQISSNPGGIILNFWDNKIDIGLLETVIERRMSWHRTKRADIMVLVSGKVLKIYRY